jgi:hypothetical protein
MDLGFTMVNSCYPMSVEAVSSDSGLSPVYAATSLDPVVRFSPVEKGLLYKALFDTIPRFRSRVRIFSPRTSLYTLIRYYLYGERPLFPCRGGIDFFFIDSRDAHTYPCGYRGNEDMGPFQRETGTRGRREPFCLECDWECFRDPSEMFGPLLEARSSPQSLLLRILRGDHTLRLWAQDLRYQWACRFFDGRRPPDLRRMKAFQNEEGFEDPSPRFSTAFSGLTEF